MRTYRVFLLVLGVAAGSTRSLAAQGRGGAPDTMAIRSTPQGFTLNFENQQISVILNALIEAGGVNAITANVPNRNTSLKMNTPVPRDSIIQVIYTFAEANGLRILGDSTGRRLMRVEGPSPTPQLSAQQLQQQALAATQLNVKQIRLRHASAVQLAPVLQNLFT